MQAMGNDADEVTKAFGMRLKGLMLTKQLEIGDLQRTLGVTYEMARRYYNGIAMPRSAKLKAIAQFVGTTESYLAYGIIEDSKSSEVVSEGPAQYNARTPPELVPLFDELKRAYNSRSLSIEAINSLRSLVNSMQPQQRDISTSPEADSGIPAFLKKREAKSSAVNPPSTPSTPDKNDELDLN